MWDLPRPELKPLSPALAGGFLTTVPPGKPPFCYFGNRKQRSSSFKVAHSGVIFKDKKEKAKSVQTDFTLLHFADIAFFFNKLKVCGNPPSSKSTSAIFPAAFAHFTSLCHILFNFFNVFIGV